MWPFQRSTRKYDQAQYEYVAYDLAHRPLPESEDLTALQWLADNRSGDPLRQILDLTTARRTASSADIVVIDDKMDEICQAMATDIKNPRHGKRLRRLKELMLAEMLELRDKARQERRGDG